MMITYPLHLIYKGITSIRNSLFDKGILGEFVPDVFTIGVGNLTVGGTGKTPMVNYLCTLLHDRQIGVISRGYGRKTRGFLALTPESTPELAGDEPCMMARHNPAVKFFVSEDRVKGYHLAQQAHPEIDTFIFDDVFQHRYLKPHLQIMLSDYHRPFYQDHVLPYGRLRESRIGAKRADAIVVTKCPADLDNAMKEKTMEEIRRYTRSDVPVFFAVYTPQTPVNEFNQSPEPGQEVILVSALANNRSFYEQQARQYKILHHYAFRDHHALSRKKLDEIMRGETPIITTGKDWVKLRLLLNANELKRFYIPDIRVEADQSFGEYIRTRMNFV